jgi:hypothetical protein
MAARKGGQAMPENSIRQRPTPLPVSIEDWERRVKTERTLNDHVEDLHITLWSEDEEYRQYLEAVWDSDAVEGSLSIDNVFAAKKIRDKALTLSGNPVGGKKLDPIVKSLGVVLRRYQKSRRERRHTVDGRIVPNDNGVE